MSLYAEQGLIETPDKEVQCAGLQGDFVVTAAVLHQLNPAHRAVEHVQYGMCRAHNIDKRMTLCMEYRQVKGKTEEELHKQMRAVATFSPDIHMEWEFTNV